MNPYNVIAALQDGSATPEQVDWAKRRVAVLSENMDVFGRLPEHEDRQLKKLAELLDMDCDWDGYPFLDGAADLSN